MKIEHDTGRPNEYHIIFTDAELINLTILSRPSKKTVSDILYQAMFSLLQITDKSYKNFDRHCPLG